MNHRIAILSLIFLLFATITVKAQYENVWIFSERSGLNFNGGSPTPLASQMTGWGEAAASVCDINGSLLFYTDGSYVWNKNNNLMPNGSNLTPMPDVNGRTATASSSQGTLIMPVPGEIQKYYVFSLTAVESGSSSGRLYYSVVDMSMDNGLGGVSASKKAILLSVNLTEKMTSVLGNDCNAWLLTSSNLPSYAGFRAFEIRDTGIVMTPVISNLGMNNSPGMVGTMLLSHDSKKLVSTQYYERTKNAILYDFDRLTGIVSNPLVLVPTSPGRSSYGACFSPDDRKLYLSALEFYQFDLSSNDSATILNSSTLLGQTTSLTNMKLGPDDKIYFKGSKNGWMGRINAPNLLGVASGFSENTLQLPTGSFMQVGLPNVVSVIKSDTISSIQSREIAVCFSESDFVVLKSKKDLKGKNYLWNDGSSKSTLQVKEAGTYWVAYYETPCIYYVDSFKLTFSKASLPQIRTVASCKDAKDGKAYIIASPNDTLNYKYSWKNSAGRIVAMGDSLLNIPTGIYSIQIQTENCDTTLFFNIEEINSKVSFQVDSFVCVDMPLLFKNNSDTEFKSFLWSFGDGNYSETNDAAHIYNKEGQYEVSLVGKVEHCFDTAYQFVYVDSIIGVDFFMDRDSICVGESVIFSHELKSNKIKSLNWQFGDGENGNLSFQQISWRHAYQSPGIMPVVLNVEFRSCPDQSFMDTVYVFSLPKVDLGPDKDLCLNGPPIVLENHHIIASLTSSSLWSTGDTTEKIKATAPGIYTLTVSTEPIGCKNSESVRIERNCYIDIPNAFTPNGDGSNDYFFPRDLLSKSLRKFKMQIFNRWGQIVFETTSINGRGWDGKFNDIDQPQGVYVYQIEVEIEGNRNEKYEGNVTLLR